MTDKQYDQGLAVFYATYILRFVDISILVERVHVYLSKYGTLMRPPGRAIVRYPVT